MYGLFLWLRDKPCLVVGGGRVAQRKVKALLETDALVTLVSPEVTESVRKLAAAKTITWEQRTYANGEAADYFLIIAATGDEAVNRQVYADSQTRERLVNVVDVPELCNFYVPAIVKRGDLRLAISTRGAAPGLSKRIRKQLEKTYPESYTHLVAALGEFRQALREHEPDIDQRKQIMDRVLDSDQIQAFLNGNETPLRELMTACISS